MNLILNVMVLVMFILIHLYRDRCFNPKKSVLNIMTAVYICLAVRVRMGVCCFRRVYSGLKTVYGLVMSC